MTKRKIKGHLKARTIRSGHIKMSREIKTLSETTENNQRKKDWGLRPQGQYNYSPGGGGLKEKGREETKNTETWERGGRTKNKAWKTHDLISNL